MSEKKIVNGRVAPWAIVAAASGGIAPNMMYLAILLTTRDGEIPQYTYYLGLLIFLLMGGAVGFFWQETNLKRAFWLGISLPALIQVGYSDFSNGSVREFLPGDVAARLGSRTGMTFSLTSTAMARRQATESETSPIYGRKVLIEIDRQFFTQTSIRNQLAVLCEHHDQKSSKRVPIPMLSTFINEQKRDGRKSNRVFVLQLDIPETAKTFRIQVEKEYSRPVTLSKTPRSANLYQLRYIKSKWSGLKRAFGQRSASTYRIELHRSGPALISFDNHAEFTRREGKYNWFEWKTFVEANQAQLDDMVTIEYKLHKTFSPQPPPAKDRSTKFAISREGWGSFWVHAIVSHSNGKQMHIQYYLDLRKRDVPEGG